MQKLFTSLMLLLILNVSTAQKFDKVKNDVLINQFEAAKADLDKIIQKTPALANTPEAIFWEAKVNSGFFKDSTLSKKYPNSFTDMRNNLEKLLSSNEGNAFINEKAKEREYNSADPFIQVYTKIRTDGVEKYNQKKYGDAAELFNVCVKYSDIFYGRGWLDTKLKSDTISILFTAICYKNAKNYAEAVPRLERLINEKSMVSIEGIYSDLLNSLIELKDKAKFDKYVAAAKIQAPAYADTWEQFELNYIEKAYDIDEKVAAFDALVSSKKLNEIEAEFFGQWFMEAKTEDKSTEKYVIKATEAFQQAHTLNPTNFRAAYNAGLSYYAEYTFLDLSLDSVRKSLQALNKEIETKLPKDKTKQAPVQAKYKPQVDAIKATINDLNGKINTKTDQAVAWYEKAFNALKDKENLDRKEKNIALRAVDYLAELYQLKSNKVKSSDPKLSAEYDKKFNIYDQLHEKYK